MVDAGAIRRRFKLIEKHLDERMRRLVAAAEAEAVGRGGLSLVARATGVSRRAIRVGARELKARGARALTSGRIRRSGGGRKRRSSTTRRLRDLEALVDPSTRATRNRPCAGPARAAPVGSELADQGIASVQQTVAELLTGAGLQPAGEPQDKKARRIPTATRSSNTSTHRYRLLAARGAGHLGRYQEEGTGRGLQEWGPGVAPSGAANAGAGA